MKLVFVILYFALRSDIAITVSDREPGADLGAANALLPTLPDLDTAADLKRFPFLL